MRLALTLFLMIPGLTGLTQEWEGDTTDIPYEILHPDTTLETKTHDGLKQLELNLDNSSNGTNALNSNTNSLSGDTTSVKSNNLIIDFQISDYQDIKFIHVEVSRVNGDGVCYSRKLSINAIEAKGQRSDEHFSIKVPICNSFVDQLKVSVTPEYNNKDMTVTQTSIIDL